MNGSLCDVGLMNDQNRAATALKKQLTINSYAKNEFFLEINSQYGRILGGGDWNIFSFIPI